MKPGRNDPCPCGSKLKYKKCCIDKPFDFEFKNDGKASVDPFITKYDSIDLLQSVAALSILQENHGKNIRLEILTLEILKHFHSSTVKSSIGDLKEFTDKNYASHYLEDPVTNLFTDLITYHGGDFLIFPGITETGSFILSNLLTSVFQWPWSNIPDQYRSNCKHAISFILNVSNSIASKMNYQRYQMRYSKSEQIEFPVESRFNEVRQSVLITNKEMISILDENGISRDVISAFTIDLKKDDFATATVEDNQLFERPIIKVDSGYLIIAPTLLSLSLTNFIWNEAKAFKCIEEVEDAYKGVLWNEAQFRLTRLGFKSLKSDESLNVSLGDFEGLYSFDQDKIAHVRLISSSRVSKDQQNSSRKSSDEIINEIKQNPKYADFNFLYLPLISNNGQDFAFPIMKQKSAKILTIQLFELSILGDLEETDAVGLWNFATALDEQLPNRPMMNFSFLDLYKIYKDKDQSFYVSDDSKDNHIYVQPGFGAELIFEAKQKRDAHSSIIEKAEKFGRSPVIRKEKYAPIYYNRNDLINGELRFLVEGFYQPIWVEPGFDLKDIKGDFRNTVFEINDAIAYWLWQLCGEIREYLKELPHKSLKISFTLNPQEKFESFERDFKRLPDLFKKFSWKVSKSTVNIQIPGDVVAYLYGSDNEGERNLVKAMVYSFNDLLLFNNLQIIPSASIETIVDKSAPLGMKKKFFVLDSNDNMLVDQRDLVDARYVQAYNVNVVLNSIVSGLGSDAPPVGVLKTKQEKLKLIRDIVIRSLLPSLKRKTSLYNCDELLCTLLTLNESLIERREFYKIQTPSRIACFVSAEQHAVDLKRTISKINEATLSIRCLVEHVAAEQARGKNQLSTTALDEMVAIMDQIIAWGLVGDQLNYDLFDFEVGILPSGRVGTEKSKVNSILDPYTSKKIEEDIQDMLNSYDSVFSQRTQDEGKDIPDFIDKSFLKEFNISLTRICKLVEILAILGFTNNQSYFRISLKDLKDHIKDSFSEAELMIGLDFLTLKERNTVEVPPPGFDNIDLSPWRFNRRLSLLRRPIIAIENLEDLNNPMLCWGSRQILLSRMYLGDQCQSGRLRVTEGGPVSKALGKIANAKGVALVEKIIAKINSDQIKIDKDVFIGPKEFLYADSDLGDVDILIIDSRSKIIYSLECKNMEPSRNVKEMVEEVSKLFGSDSERGWIQKHLDRDSWLKQNIALLSKKYSIDLTGYQVKSFFVTAEGMLTPILKGKDLPIPFVSKYDVERKGLGAFAI